MQTASLTGAFAADVTHSTQTVNSIGAFAADETRGISPLPLTTQPGVVNPLV